MMKRSLLLSLLISLLFAPAPWRASASREAKFTTTTICGHPVKVSGVITYNFVLQ